MWKLDDLSCDVCRKRGCVSWSFTEGARCHDHSTYVVNTRQIVVRPLHDEVSWQFGKLRRAMEDKLDRLHHETLRRLYFGENRDGTAAA